MDRLTAYLFVAGVLFSCTVLAACGSDIRKSLDPRFAEAVTALWISHYEENPVSHQFVRSTAWGQVPEKLVPDGLGGYSVAVPLLVQSETSDGPQPDQFLTVLVRVLRTDDHFSLAPNEALPGDCQSRVDFGRRTVWFLGKTWQFQGRF